MDRVVFSILVAACSPPEAADEPPSSPSEVAPGPCDGMEPHVASITNVDDELPIGAGPAGGAFIDSLGFEVLVSPVPGVALVLAMVDEETEVALEIFAGEPDDDPAYSHRFVAISAWSSEDCSGTIEPFHISWWPEDFMDAVCAIDGQAVRVDSWAFEVDSWPVTDLGEPQASATYVARVDDVWDC